MKIIFVSGASKSGSGPTLKWNKLSCGPWVPPLPPPLIAAAHPTRGPGRGWLDGTPRHPPGPDPPRMSPRFSLPPGRQWWEPGGFLASPNLCFPKQLFHNNKQTNQPNPQTQKQQKNPTPKPRGRRRDPAAPVPAVGTAGRAAPSGRALRRSRGSVRGSAARDARPPAALRCCWW